MTLYARGYRRYERTGDAGFRGRLFAFGPILAEGWRDARRGWAFRLLGTVIVAITTIHGFLLYLQRTPLLRQLEAPRRGPVDIPIARPSVWLEAAIASFHTASWAFVALLTLFVGAGLVADDLRSRALPLYLARPIAPVDYYLGKLLIPVCVLALLVLLPMLVLVLLAVLLRPREEMLAFLGAQTPLVAAIVLYFTATALAYSSLVLLYSAWTSRRITAVILGAVTLLGGEIVRNAAGELRGGTADALRATSLVADTKVLLFEGMGRSATTAGENPYPSVTAAVVALSAVVLLGAVAVLRRARSAEVSG